MGLYFAVDCVPYIDMKDAPKRPNRSRKLPD